MRLEYFDLIDKVDELDLEGSKIRISARLPERSPIFDGHFPNFPILPGVMMLEIMNHAAGYLLYRRYNGERFVFLGGVKRAKFRRMIRPGDTIEAQAHLTHEGSGFSVAETTLTSGGVTAADAEIILISQAFPNAEIKAALARHSETLLAPAEA